LAVSSYNLSISTPSTHYRFRLSLGCFSRLRFFHPRKEQLMRGSLSSYLAKVCICTRLRFFSATSQYIDRPLYSSQLVREDERILAKDQAARTQDPRDTSYIGRYRAFSLINHRPLIERRTSRVRSQKYASPQPVAAYMRTSFIVPQ
jgi:hypothetical protein